MIKKVLLEEIATVTPAGDKPKEFSNTKTESNRIPVIANGLENQGIVGYTTKAKITREAVTLSARGNIGTPFYRSEPYYPIIRLLTLLPKDGIDCKYLYYLLLNTTLAGGGSVQSQLTVPDVSSMEVFYEADNATQKKISSILGAIDSKITNNNVICSTLESMASLVYDYWFVQFDFPNEKGRPYKSSGGKMVWCEILKREIPEGWEVGSIVNNPLTTVIKPGVDKFDSKNYLPTANVNGESISDGDWITFENRETRANMQPTVNSVWFAKLKNSVKHISIPANGRWFTSKYILSTGFEGIQCNQDSFGFIHCFINSNHFELHKDSLAHGATQESVNNSDLESIKFAIPPHSVLKAFSKFCNPVLDVKFGCIYENQQLASLRDFLLPMLMNGQVKFKK